MNKILTGCGLLLLLLGHFSSSIRAQTREISEQEYKQVEDAAYKKTSAESHRKTLKSQHFYRITDKSPYLERSIITEFTPSGYSQILEDKRGDKIERTETIELNKRKYLRKNNGKWEDVTEPKGGGGTGLFARKVESTETFERRYLGKQTINGQTVDVYEEKVTRKYDGDARLSVNEEKIWIDQNGRYLKTETKTRVGDEHIFAMTVDYEYDPRIRITPPRIK